MFSFKDLLQLRRNEFRTSAIKRKNGKLIINIPPVISHQKHHQNFYLFAAYYLISSLLIASFCYCLNVFGLIYLVLFFLRIIAFDLLASLILVVQGVMFFMVAVSTIAVWSTIGFFQGLSVFYLLPIVLFFDVLFVPHLQHKLIRAMLFSTFIECNRKGMTIIRNGFVEFKSKHKPTMLQIQQFTEIEYKFLLSEGEPKYQFGGLLTSSEQEWLIAEITNYYLSLKPENHDYNLDNTYYF